jgi:hypothetical protein
VSVARSIAFAVLASGCLSKPSFECTFATASALEIDGQIGTDGGNPHDPFHCDTRSVVGVGFTMSQTVNQEFMEKNVIAARLLCATVETRDGRYTAGEPEEVSGPGGSESSDGPFFERCPDGQVVIGLAAHILDTLKDSLFNSVAMDCSAIDESGAPTGDVTRIPLLATGARPPDVEARCLPGRVLLGLKPWTGNDLDRVELACAQTACVRSP